MPTMVGGGDDPLDVRKCKRRLNKAVSHDPNKTQARHGILSDMPAYLETADDEQREEMRQMLNDIADLPTDEESPTMNTGGRAIGVLCKGLQHMPQLLPAWCCCYTAFWVRWQWQQQFGLR